MIQYRLIERPAFDVIGLKTWISGQDNGLFGAFWGKCGAEGVLGRLEQLRGQQTGTQTNAFTLGISQVEQDPTRREFYYMIAIEKPAGAAVPADLETYQVPASLWAVFECRGPLPEAIINSEIYAFTQWLPASEYVHANAPEMEVYCPAPEDEPYCEFWLPIRRKA